MLRTLTPSSLFSASRTISPWETSVVLQETSTTMWVWCDSVTSKAVMWAPAEPTALASSLVAVIEAGVCTRSVNEYPGLGAAISSSCKKFPYSGYYYPQNENARVFCGAEHDFLTA